MSRFTYTAEKTGGEVYKGIAEAKDRFELYAIVRREGGRIVSVSEERAHHALSLTYWNEKFTTIKEYDKIIIARNLGAMISAGLSLARALAVMERQTKNQRLSRVLGEIANEVRHGETLHQALTKFPRVFSKLFIAIVRAGEEGGDLPQSLTGIAEQMERMHTLKKKVQGALIYPAIIVIAIVGIGVLMMTQVVPTLAQTFKEMGTELPYSTQVIIGMSTFLTEYSVLAILLTIIVGGGFYGILKTTLGKRSIEWLVLATPLIGGIVREVNAARTARTLSSLLAAGVDVLSALDIVREVVQNSYFRTVIEAAKAGVGKGEPLSAAFSKHEHLYPPFVGEMLSVGEETGQLTEMLKRLAVFYEEEVDRRTRDMSTVIEPFLMVAIGGAVGFFAVSMISPIYQLSQNI